MTLLEAVVAFVLLAVVGVTCLDLSRRATELERRSVEWTQAVAEGEALLTETIAGDGSSVQLTAGGSADRSGYQLPASVSRSPWLGGGGVDVVTVVVKLSGGQSFQLSRMIKNVPSSNGQSTR